MQNQKIVFSQIASLIPWYQFDKIVKEFGGDYRCKKFKSRDQLLVMIFAQLTYREGLRSIESSLNSQRAKLYHMGIRCEQIARNTLAKANEVRDYKIYESLANLLTIRAKELYSEDKILDDFEFNKSIYALDSSVINICLSLAPWAKYMHNQKVGAIKLHSLIDLKGNIPSFNVITDGKVYDGAILDILHLRLEVFTLWIEAISTIKDFIILSRINLFSSLGPPVISELSALLQTKILKINFQQMKR